MKTIVKNLLLAVALGASTLAIASEAGATQNANTCVDGRLHENIAVTWNSNSEVTVGPRNNGPLCNDIEIHFSSYTMPDTYNGQPFANNPTASPQTIFDDSSVVLKKGSKTPVKLNIDLPKACKNIQVDVYFAPKIETVRANGHGDQYLTGKIINKTTDVCDTPVTPEVPTPEAQEPETPAPEVVIPTVPVELPETGNGASTLLTTASLLSVSTYAGVLAAAKRRM